MAGDPTLSGKFLTKPNLTENGSLQFRRTQSCFPTIQRVVHRGTMLVFLIYYDKPLF
jgi:hypothetical protein